MKKRIVSGWVLSFSSEESLLEAVKELLKDCLLYTSPSPRDRG